MSGEAEIVTAGPTICEICGFWPAGRTERGNRCHICSAREWCEAHPVPLPSAPGVVKLLAAFGYEPAIAAIGRETEKDGALP